MSSGFYDQALLTEHLEVALEELAQASGSAAGDRRAGRVRRVPARRRGVGREPAASSAWRFSARHIVLGRRASRFKADFDLNLSGLSLVLTYLQRIEEMEAELARLRAQLLK